MLSDCFGRPHLYFGTFGIHVSAPTQTPNEQAPSLQILRDTQLEIHEPVIDGRSVPPSRCVSDGQPLMQRSDYLMLQLFDCLLRKKAGPTLPRASFVNSSAELKRVEKARKGCDTGSQSVPSG